jgi:glutamate-1-semialdehyde 2,1-aminomutase
VRVAAHVLPGGNTRSVLYHPPFPLTMVRGEGCWLWDADGHVYIDTLGEFTAGLFGHSDKTVRAAVQEALVGGSTCPHTAREARLGRRSSAAFPPWH